jgi:aspartate/methionine/tyrosine aminotransferase
MKDEKHFISGWKTSNPFATRYLGKSADIGESAAVLGGYTFLADSEPLVDAIRRFHAHADGRSYAKQSIYVSSGSSPLLLGFFLALGELGIEEMWYAPPVYYSCYYFCRKLRIAMNRLPGGLLHSPDALQYLPRERTALIMTDPVWIFGTTVHEDNIEKLSQWQSHTGSVIFVDGTFQYAKWSPADIEELTSRLDPDLTFRLICPTKSLAVHGVRFAYTLLPERLREAIRYPCANITGATGASNERYALKLMEVLSSAERNRALVEHIRDTHHRLRTAGLIIDEPFTPIASYYTFARMDARAMADAIVMDQRFFELTGFDGMVRVNLLHSEWATGASF